MNKSDLTEKEQKIAQLLLIYMQKNPDAKHTAEGIARWWIMQQTFEEDIQAVEKTIEYFLKLGILEEIVLPEGNKYFKLHLEKIKEVL